MNNELDKFNFLNEYNPSKGGQLLVEQLVPARFNDLKNAIEQDKELYLFLTTPAVDLPEAYKYLVQEITPDIENQSLYNVMVFTLNGRGNIFSFFSMTGNRITGFVAYEIGGNEVTEIKMFSFNPQPGSAAVLMRDLINLLDELVSKFDKVSWIAFKGNPANRIYQKAIEKYGGNMVDSGEEIRYTIICKKC